MFDLDRITPPKIAECLKQDPIFRKSIGIAYTYPIVKYFAIMWVVWLVTLALTPLPEQALVSRIGLVCALVAAIICFLLDIAGNKLKLKEASESLSQLFREKPKVTLEVCGEKTRIVHEDFVAQCNVVTKLKLKTMLDYEEELKNILQATMGSEWVPWNKKKSSTQNSTPQTKPKVKT